MKGIRDKNCRLCNLYETCKTVCLMGQGPKNPDIMLVGEAPGATEDNGGLPFQGRAGQLLNKILDSKGLDRSKVYVTNAVKCRPPANATPNKTQVKACNPYLMQEIEAVKPKVIVTLGNTPLLAVTKKSGITKHRGEPLKMTFGSHTCTVIPTVHPAAILRNPKYRPLIEADLDAVESFLKHGKIEDNLDQKKFKVHIVTNKKRLKECLHALERAYVKNRLIAYDLETEGNQYWNPEKRIWLLGIADRDDRAWVVPIEHPESPWKENGTAVLKLFRKYLETAWFWKAAQNGKFDDGWLRARGIKSYLNFDSILAQHLIDENSPKGLEFLSMVHFKASNWGKGHIQFTYEYNKKGVCIKEPSSLKEMGKYNGIDCIYTRKLYAPLKAQLMDDEKLARIFKFISMPGSRLLVEVENNGLWINRKQLGKRYIEAKHNCDKAEQLLESFVPDDYWEIKNKKKPKSNGKNKINWNSSDQVGEFFFSSKRNGGLGLRIVEETRGGKPSTAEHTMIELKGKHPACDALLEYRKWAKYLNTYIEPWLEYSNNHDSRMHPVFKIWGTVTGRLSSEHPNPQQTPRDKFLRTNIGAPDGWSFVESDYSQVELRVVAFLSGDPRMVQAYAVGDDIHSITACDLLGISRSELDASPNRKELRKMAKAVNFGYVYGMWWKKFKQYAKDNYGVEVTDEEAKQHRERFFKLYRGLKPWHDRQLRIVKKMKQVRAPHGRIRHLPDIDSSEEGISKEAGRQAINSPVQGFASGDLTLLSAILFDRIVKRFFDPKKVKVVLLVHDAIMVEVKDDYLDEIIPVLKGVMENPPLMEYFDLDFTVPLVADVQVGPAWGEGKDRNMGYDVEKIKGMIKEVMYYEEELPPVSDAGL